MNARSDKEKLMDFQCTLRQHGRLEHWTAQIRLISCNESQQELEIKGRGSSFHLFVGFGMFGNYLCIPSQDIGCAIAQPEDSFWNAEHLSRHLNIVDTTTITTGLKYLDQP